MKGIGGILQVLAAVLGGVGILLSGIAALWGVIKPPKPTTITGTGPQRPKKSDKKQRKFSIVCFSISLVLIAIVFLIVSLIIPFFKSKVEITSAITGQQIEVRIAETGSGSFIISGTSSKIFDAPDLRVYVLVHPADPFAAGWWIQQPATVDRNGEWTTLAWIGSPDFPPHVGDKIEILVIAANPIYVSKSGWIIDPKAVNPVAQSDNVKISIGSIIK